MSAATVITSASEMPTASTVPAATAVSALQVSNFHPMEPV